MNITNEVLDRIKSELDLPSDYAISKVLGVTKTTVYDYRANRRSFADNVAIKAAEILNIEPFEILTKLYRERAISDFQRSTIDQAEQFKNLQKLLNNKKLKSVFNNASKRSPDLKKLIDEVQEYILCSIGHFPETSNCEAKS